MLSIILVASIAVAVVLGYKTKINTGFFCIAFAYLIGCFGMGIKPKELISFWPVSTMFVILSVSLFYNFAAVNGTLEKMSASLLYMCRRFPGMLPFALFFVAVVLSVMGAAYFTVLAFLAPITILICEEAKMDKLTGAVAINCGALAGGNFPTASLASTCTSTMKTILQMLCLRRIRFPYDSVMNLNEMVLRTALLPAGYGRRTSPVLRGPWNHCITRCSCSVIAIMRNSVKNLWE